MTHKYGLTLATTLALAVAGTFGSVSGTVARMAQDLSGPATDISAQATNGMRK